jgi:hypothetical protein
MTKIQNMVSVIGVLKFVFVPLAGIFADAIKS